MAWTTPRTWVTNEIVTAAIMNAHVRDNLRETSAFTVSAAGALPYADAANSVNSEVLIGANGSTLVSDGSAPLWRLPTQASGNDTALTGVVATGYTDLDDSALDGGAGAGEAIAVTITTGTRVRLDLRASLLNGTGGQSTNISYRISGATTSGSADSKSLRYESSNAGDFADIGTFSFAQVTAGSNTFTMQGRVSGGSGTIRYTRLLVTPLS